MPPTIAPTLLRVTPCVHPRTGAGAVWRDAATAMGVDPAHMTDGDLATTALRAGARALGWGTTRPWLVHPNEAVRVQVIREYHSRLRGDPSAREATARLADTEAAAAGEIWNPMLDVLAVTWVQTPAAADRDTLTHRLVAWAHACTDRRTLDALGDGIRAPVVQEILAEALPNVPDSVAKRWVGTNANVRRALTANPGMGVSGWRHVLRFAGTLVAQQASSSTMGRASTIQEIGTVVSSLLSTRGAAWLKPLLPAVAEVLPWVAAPLIGQARWPIADPAVSASVVSLLTHANEAVREAMALSVASTADER